MQVSNTGYLQQVQGFRGMIYGKSGVGKTCLAATCEAPLIIATEPGLLSVRRFNIPFIAAQTPDLLRETARWLATTREAQQYKTILIDSVSETLEGILAEERGRAGKEPRRAYGELHIKALDLMRLFRDLQTGHNVVFIAKQERVQDGETGVILYGPKFPGKAVGVDAPYLFDFVIAMVVERNHGTGQDERFFITQPTNQYEAKDRSGMLLPKEGAHLQYLLNKIQGVV